MKRIAESTTKRVWGAGPCWGILLAAAALSGTCLAAQQAAQQDNAGTATRAVRLSYVQGQVQITSGAEAIVSQAAANMPVFEGYRITTGQDGQAEVQFEDGSVARIAPDSGLTLKVLRGQGSSGQAEMVLDGGLGYFELQGGDQAGRIAVRFGDAVATAGGFTVMRIDEDTPPGSLAVFSGNAHLVRGDSVTLDLHGNESVALNTSDPSQYNLAETIETNSWDQWNSDRDQALQAQSTTQSKATDSFVNSNNPAWNDLNSSGNWYDVPGSGYVWSPFMAVNAGWDPYGCGQWVMTPGFGYTWVSCYAWGYMPYSCGTWNFYGSFGWGWSPGMGGCSPWWGSGYGGYAGPNIGAAPSGYHPVIRPPLQLRSPKDRLPRPILVDRQPKHGYGGHTLRSTNGPVMIAGHVVSPLKPMPARTSFARPGRVVVAGGATNRAIMGGSQPRLPEIVDRGPREHGYGPPARTSAGGRTAGEGYRQPHGYQPQPVYRAEPRGYTPPAQHGYAPPAQRRGEPAPSRGGFSNGARPSGGSYSGRGNGGGGSFHGNAGGGGSFHGGGGGSYSGGGARSGGGFSGGGAHGGGGGGFHGGGGAAPAGGGGGAHGGGGNGAAGGHR